jgi:hypothetical protein
MRFPPILIMPLLTVILVCLLLSPSDEIAITGILLAFTGTMCVTFVVFGTTEVEKRIGKRRLAWPKNALKLGALFWGVAVLVFMVQLSTIVRDFGIPNVYETLFSGGVALCGIAGFESYLTFRFIMNPQYRPQINLGGVLLFLMIGMLDAMTIYVFIPLYPMFEMLLLAGKILTILLVTSFVSSIVFLWAWWKEKSNLLVNATFMLTLSPYVFIIAVFFFLVVYGLIMI